MCYVLIRLHGGLCWASMHRAHYLRDVSAGAYLGNINTMDQCQNRLNGMNIMFLLLPGGGEGGFRKRTLRCRFRTQEYGMSL